MAPPCRPGSIRFVALSAWRLPTAQTAATIGGDPELATLLRDRQ
jgi:hypothetical protein